ncbi:NAD(P)-binding protein [Athelia psychrophila]|uniref:NAD(P)-binding protein n=1 Tax=Athelia psychrophila TaxID=1759441 RepID=A0A166FQX9_9AGAM|nr:NAD(P)-binding protein [Fibularhizoctonia sp. CBS 109695]
MYSLHPKNPYKVLNKSSRGYIRERCQRWAIKEKEELAEEVEEKEKSWMRSSFLPSCFNHYNQHLKMPNLQPPAKVLVSGANGFVAIWVVRTLLEKGYAVRGTVRSANKGNHLKEIFAEYGDNLEVLVVEDITKEGAFDAAVKGVDTIEHTASPFHMNAVDPEELIQPAVKGTVGMLKSAFKYGSSVKRIVVTSSCAAVYEDFPDARVFSELDWNEQAIKEVQEKGKDALPGNKYRSSKTLAEKAAWAFVKDNKPKWDLVVLNPPYVFGPPIHAVSAPSDLNTSVADWYQTVLTPNAAPEKLKTGNCWIDVRDLALAHVRAVEREEAGGERIVISQGSFPSVNAVNALPKSALFGVANQTIPRGDPAFVEPTPHIAYNTSKAARVLGMGAKLPGQGINGNFVVLKGLGECAQGMVEEFGRRGW